MMLEPAVGEGETCALEGRRMGKFSERPLVCLLETVSTVAPGRVGLEGVDASKPVSINDSGTVMSDCVDIGLDLVGMWMQTATSRLDK